MVYDQCDDIDVGENLDDESDSQEDCDAFTMTEESEMMQDQRPTLFEGPNINVSQSVDVSQCWDMTQVGEALQGKMLLIDMKNIFIRYEEGTDHGDGRPTEVRLCLQIPAVVAIDSFGNVIDFVNLPVHIALGTCRGQDEADAAARTIAALRIKYQKKGCLLYTSDAADE